MRKHRRWLRCDDDPGTQRVALRPDGVYVIHMTNGRFGEALRKHRP